MVRSQIYRNLLNQVLWAIVLWTAQSYSSSHWSCTAVLLEYDFKANIHKFFHNKDFDVSQFLMGNSVLIWVSKNFSNIND